MAAVKNEMEPDHECIDCGRVGGHLKWCTVRRHGFLVNSKCGCKHCQGRIGVLSNKNNNDLREMRYTK